MYVKGPLHGRQYLTDGALQRFESLEAALFPIDLEPNGRPFAVPNQSKKGKYNLISV